MRWTRKSIVAEIRELYARGAELNYAAVEAENLNLVRAAAWHFGTWRRAIEAAGIEYEKVCKYRRWTQARIVERIRELHAEGADLSWRSVSAELDPPLAAAALRPNGFRNWRDAIAAAGLDIGAVARYQSWSGERVLRDIKTMKKAREPLSSKAVQSANQPLFCAARRRFGSWDAALQAAGLASDKIRLRRPAAPSAKTTGPAAKTVVPKTAAVKTRVQKPKPASARKPAAKPTATSPRAPKKAAPKVSASQRPAKRGKAPNATPRKKALQPAKPAASNRKRVAAR